MYVDSGPYTIVMLSLLVIYFTVLVYGTVWALNELKWTFYIKPELEREESKRRAAEEETGEVQAQLNEEEVESAPTTQQ